MKLKQWRSVKPYRGPQWPTEVDLWLRIYASPMSFGMADSFRVVDAYRRDGKWLHRQHGQELELNAEYITHWMAKPKPPIKNM